jgi:hypothetical protein
MQDLMREDLQKVVTIKNKIIKQKKRKNSMNYWD